MFAFAKIPKRISVSKPTGGFTRSAAMLGASALCSVASLALPGTGLLPEGENNIAHNGTQKVFATLICETKEPFILRNTYPAGVALAANGDFRMDDALNPAPSDCTSPVLLIRNTAGAWFAAASAKRPESEPDNSRF